jgi:hypothetical protein
MQSLVYSQQATTWQVVTNMLWLSLDGCVGDMGPLLRAALPAAVPASQAATEAAEDSDGAAAAEAAETAVQCVLSAETATMASLFSMCISAVKLLTQVTRDCSPYATMENEGQSPAAVLEHIQQCAAIIIRSSAFAGASQPQGSSETDAAELMALPWAVLMLRCVQLGLAWAQDAAASLLGSRGSSNTGTSVEAAAAAAAAEHSVQAGTLNDDDVQQLEDVVQSLCQLEDGLQVLSWAFSRWLVEPHSAAGGQQQPAATVALPQLQQCQQQLQQELLPAVVGFLEKAGLKCSSSSSSADVSSASGGGSPAQATPHQQTTDPAATADSGRQQLEEFWASVPVSWVFSDSASGSKWWWEDADAAVQQLLEQVPSDIDATEQQQQEQQNQKQLWEEL